MPFGRYTVLGEDGQPVGIEEFRSAPGVAGWRYFSEVETTDPTPHHETIDVAVDAGWRIAHMRVATGTHELLLRADAEGGLTGFRDGRPIEIPGGPGAHVDYFTPATNVISARRLAGTAEIEVAYLEPVTLALAVVGQRYELLGTERVDTPVGGFDATRWRVTALDSGW